MFHLSDSLLVEVALGLLVATVASSRGGGVVLGGIRIEFPDVKKCNHQPTPQKPLVQTSRRAPSSVKVDLRQRISPVIGWWAGSTVMSEHTSVRRVVRKSQTSLWRTVGSLPVELIAWSGNRLCLIVWKLLQFFTNLY